MNTSQIKGRGLLAGLAIAIVCAALALPQNSRASGGATDPIPGTSKSGVKSGGGSGGSGGGGSGGGGGSITPAPAPAPAPAPQPIIIAPLTFTPMVSIDNIVPQCSGSYRIDPYYPTLSLMTVTVQTSSVNLPDNSYLFVSVNGTGGTLYPFTSNAILLTAGAGSCSYNVYVTPGTVIQSVNITDASGVPLLTGN